MMSETILNKRTLIVCLLIVLVMVVMIWLFVPRLVQLCAPLVNKLGQESVTREGFAEEENRAEQLGKPTINANVGSVVDGPGFEKGEVDGVSQESLSNVPSNYYFLDDGDNGAMSIQHNLCSKSCCSAQWPTPFKTKWDPYVCGNKDKYVPSNYMCNNSFQDSGCLCLTKDQARFMYMRGTNGRELF